MWDRKELKLRGNVSFKRAYGTAVAVCLILSIVSGIFTSGNDLVNKKLQPQIQHNEFAYSWVYNICGVATSYTLPVTASSGATADGMDSISKLISNAASPTIIIFSLCTILASLVLRFLILVPLTIGSNRFYMELREDENTPLNRILYIFRHSKFRNSVLIIILMNLYIFLWSLLLLIPGIIKTYEYRMVPYILSENPGIEPKRAFKLSKEMMTGNKMKSLILDLSFIGLYLLSIFTLGILNVLYVNPFVSATNAELYAVLREDLMNRDIADETDFPGFGKIDTLDAIM